MVQVISDKFRRTGELWEFTGGSIGPYWDLVERGEGPQEDVAHPHGLVQIGLGGGGAPLFPSPSPSFPLSPSPLEGKGGPNPTTNRVLVGLPPLGAPS